MLKEGKRLLKLSRSFYLLKVCFLMQIPWTSFSYCHFYSGLSHFVVASFVEDKFGVVQKDLPEILSMLLDLQAV